MVVHLIPQTSPANTDTDAEPTKATNFSKTDGIGIEHSQSVGIVKKTKDVLY